jgi:hypothetical protein
VRPGLLLLGRHLGQFLGISGRPGGEAFGVGLFGQGQDRRLVLAASLLELDELAHGRGVRKARAVSQRRHETSWHEAADFGLLLHWLLWCMFAKI